MGGLLTAQPEFEVFLTTLAIRHCSSFGFMQLGFLARFMYIRAVKGVMVSRADASSAQRRCLFLLGGCILRSSPADPASPASSSSPYLSSMHRAHKPFPQARPHEGDHAFAKSAASEK